MKNQSSDGQWGFEEGPWTLQKALGHCFCFEYTCLFIVVVLLLVAVSLEGAQFAACFWLCFERVNAIGGEREPARPERAWGWV